MKWYTFNDEENNSTLSLLLDHNTTARIQYNPEGLNTSKVDIDNELNKLMTESNWQVTPTLISALDIASIVGNTNFTTSSDPFYLDMTEEDPTKFKYGWLYDRTSINCNTTTNCPFNADNTETTREMWGYWTSSIRWGQIWVVDNDGRLHDANPAALGCGIRPVIQIQK